jgi:hypothetical protein
MPDFSFAEITLYSLAKKARYSTFAICERQHDEVLVDRKTRDHIRPLRTLRPMAQDTAAGYLYLLYSLSLRAIGAAQPSALFPE